MIRIRYVRPRIFKRYFTVCQEREEKEKEIKHKDFEKQVDYLNYMSIQHAIRN